jgi:hypothetical protein
MPISVIGKATFGPLSGSEDTIGTKQGSQKLLAQDKIVNKRTE